VQVAAQVTFATLQPDIGRYYTHQWVAFFAVAGLMAVAIVVAGVRKMRERDDHPRRRRVEAFLIGIVASFAVLCALDAYFTLASVPITLTRQINVFLPYFVGGVILYTLANIEREYRAELVSRQRIEHDLEVAREIQDSLAPPPAQVFAGDLRVACYHVKHDKVAGDWMALRSMPNGDLIAVVADATGKGIQAALVAHALQSLWADSLADAEFDPAAWVARVNRTLYRLGETKPHSLTLGIVRIAGDRVTYWSAGHVPLFIVRREASGRSLVSPLMARGAVLGLAPEVALTESTTVLPPGAEVSILLGTDGVFVRGSRSGRREVLGLVEQLTASGVDALAATVVEDDKTLVVITRSVA
jgi:hypothetical protein